MKKCLKIICLFVLLLNFVVIFPKDSLATDDNFKFSRFEKDEYQNTKVDTMTKKVMGTALAIIRVVAIGIAVIMLTYVAIKYMTSAPGERADFKKSATIYIVGAFLVLGAQAILKVISSFVENNL